MRQEMELPAETVQLEKAQDFVESSAKEVGFSAKERGQLRLVVEELFINVALYAYGPQGGVVRLVCEAKTGELVLTLSDSGRAFNPLHQPPPDFDTPQEDRKEGGLGIFLARTYSDEMHYRRENGRNVLTVTKRAARRETPDE